MANVSSSNGLEKRPKLAFRRADGSSFPSWSRTSLSSIIEPYSEKVYGEHKYEVLTSSREGLQRQVDHFGSEQRHDTDGYNVIPFGYCTYRNRSDDGRFAFNINTISSNAIVSKFYPVFRFTNANSLFMSEFLNSSSRAKKKLSVLAVGTSQVVLSFEALKAAEFDLPCKDEQDKIASFFECLNRRIEYQRTLVDALKKYKRGVNKQLLSQIDNSCNCRLGSVCEIVGGGTPDTLHTEYWGSTVEWFTPSEIGKTKYVSSSVRKLSDIGLNNSSAKLLPIGTVLLTTRATLGEMSIAKRECCTNQGFQSLIPHQDRVLSEYLYYMQIIIKPWCEKYASGNTFREISKSALSNCIIPLPDRTKQEEIVKLLSSIDILISAEEGIAMSLSKMRHSLVQQLFI